MRHAARAGVPDDATAVAMPGGVRARGARTRATFGPRRTTSVPASPAARAADVLRRAAAAALATRRRRMLAALLAALLTWLASFHPGDETLRALSDSPLRLMVSRSGFSFGRAFSVGPKPRAPRPGAPPPVRAPRWRGGLNLTAEALRAAPPPGQDCLASVLDGSPHLVLSDAGTVVLLELSAAASAAPFAGLTCTLYRLVRSVTPSLVGSISANLTAAAFRASDLAAAAWPERAEGGRVAIISSASSAAALAPYHVTLRNRRQYAADHGYAAVLALVPASALGGRSPKMAKHYAMGTLAAGALGRFDVLVHLDLDAWFASWAPVGEVTRGWPPEKELLVPDAGQLWLNSGLLLARGGEPWTARFFASVLDARHDDVAGEGFKRDQPALWAVLAQAWRDEGALPSYEAERCAAWRDACNPDANPVECWHWCFWGPLQRMRGEGGAPWGGLRSITHLPHVHVPPRRAHGGRAPPLHRLCLATCPSALARAPGLLCAALLGKAAAQPGGVCGPPPGADAVSRCDGAGCLRQLAAGGGAWVKHSGHQHWHDALPRCVPTDAAQAASRLTALAGCPAADERTAAAMSALAV